MPSTSNSSSTDFDLAAVEADEISPEMQNLVDPMNSGFSWYLPPPHYNDAQWTVAGDDYQVLTVTVAPQETIVTEVASFMMGSHGMEMDIECTCRTNEGCRRICGGESCVKLLLKNNSPASGYVGLTPGYPAKIVPIEFGKHIGTDHAIIAQPGTYMSQLGDVHVACDLDCSYRTCCCAGFGCCRQKISGPDQSIAFLAAGGTLMFRDLEPGEQVTVDSRSVVAMEDTVRLGIVSNGKLGTCCFGGEGCFSTTLTGPGKIFMQSMNLQKFKDAVQTTIMDDRAE